MTPVFNTEKFTCPHCGNTCLQYWFIGNSILEKNFNRYFQIFLNYRSSIDSYEQQTIEKFLNHSSVQMRHMLNIFLPEKVAISECSTCKNILFWLNREVAFPKLSKIEDPNEDLSPEIKKIYNEAATILIYSPRGAAALLRLALQLLLQQLELPGKNINDDIKKLVANGLDPIIQQSLDILRVVGNNAVHPGEIILNENKDVALSLFPIINAITQQLITNPKKIKNIYQSLPKNIQDAIEQRDKMN